LVEAPLREQDSSQQHATQCSQAAEGRKGHFVEGELIESLAIPSDDQPNGCLCDGPSQAWRESCSDALQHRFHDHLSASRELLTPI